MPTAKPAVKPIDYAPYGYASGYTQGNTHDDAHNYVYGYAFMAMPQSYTHKQLLYYPDIAATITIFHGKRINI
jgi:hypothetical protein